jgi:hypothetical protein
MWEASPVDGWEFAQNMDVGVASGFGLQPDFETSTVRQLFNIPLEVVNINDNFAGSQSVDPGSESRLGSCLSKVIAKNIDGGSHFHYGLILPLAD